MGGGGGGLGGGGGGAGRGGGGGGGGGPPPPPPPAHLTWGAHSRVGLRFGPNAMALGQRTPARAMGVRPPFCISVSGYTVLEEEEGPGGNASGSWS